MKASDVGSSSFLIVLGGFVAWQSKKLSLGVPWAPGPGFFPFCSGLLLIGIALIILVQGVRQKPKVRETLRKGRVILAIAAIFAYALVFEHLGYLLSTFLLMLLLLRMMERKSWWLGTGLAALISMVSYFLFKVCLKVNIPGGFLGF